MSRKVCYIVSDIDKAIAFEWIAEKLDPVQFELSFILITSSRSSCLGEFLKKKGIQVKQITLKGKKDYPLAILHCLKCLTKLNPAIVHCHLRHASFIGLLSSKLLGIRKRIYTRHHSSFHHEFHPKAIKWDHFANALATDIVAISENVKQVLEEKERVGQEKIHLIHNGFDLYAFQNVSEKRIQSLKNKYFPKDFHGKVIGVIGRYIEWKGHKYIIQAAREILHTKQDILFVFANAAGPDEKKIRAQIRQSLPNGNYIEIIFEEDLFALYQLFDLYVHVPINKNIEAFGQTYVEALAAGVPSIFTLSGVAKEFIVDDKNAIVVPYKDSIAIANAIEKLLHNAELRSKLITKGKESIEQFDLTNFIQKLERLYLNRASY